MFKFVVLCAFVAAATATPGFVAPLAGHGYVAPTTYVSSAPLLNTWPGAAYSAPVATTYAAGPLAATYSSPLYTHLIKKRSVGYVAPTTYVASAPYVAGPYAAAHYAAAPYAAAHYAAAPYAAAHYAAAPYATAPVVSSPYVSTSPLAYSHFIKKRSVALPVAAYTAPAAYSHQSRFDYQATSPAISTYSTYSYPQIYSSPIALSSF